MVRAVTQRFPKSPFVVAVGGITPGLVVNPKIERLIGVARRYWNDTLKDIRIERVVRDKADSRGRV